MFDELCSMGSTSLMRLLSYRSSLLLLLVVLCALLLPLLLLLSLMSPVLLLPSVSLTSPLTCGCTAGSRDRPPLLLRPGLPGRGWRWRCLLPSPSLLLLRAVPSSCPEPHRPREESTVRRAAATATAAVADGAASEPS
jgi:hypothetical protein